MKKLAAALVLSFTVAIANPTFLWAQQDAVASVSIHNFHKVNDAIYRGAEPSIKDLTRLKELGIKTIVDLRGRDDQEEKEASKLGMKYVNFPMRPLGRPAPGSVEQVVKLITSTDSQPVYIHCRRGSDRTGTVIALYRITQERWTADRAIKEAEGFGMSFWERGMKSYIRDSEKVSTQTAAR